MTKTESARRRSTRVAGIAALATLGALATALLLGSAAQAADPQDVIDYRRNVMKTMGEQVGILGMIAQNRAPPADLATHAKALAITAATAKSAFEENVPGGDAKPEVWAQWADFSKRLDGLVTATRELEKSASGGPAAVGPKLQELGCKGCHDTYRAKK